MGKELYELGPYPNKADISVESSGSSKEMIIQQRETHADPALKKDEGISIFNPDNGSEVVTLDKRGGSDEDGSDGVTRGLKQRHMSMISLGGAIGTGLFFGIATPIHVAGPVGSLIAYLFVGTLAYFVTQSLGEMATYLPVTSSFTVYTKRFLSPSLSVATGYIYWVSWCITFALELSIIGQLIQYWTFAVPLSAWIAISWVLLMMTNMFPVRFYGEVEFWVASMKLLGILGFIIYAFLMVCGAGPGGAIGFRYWRNPGPWGTGIISANKNEARFLGWVSSLIKAAYTYQGTELVGLTAGESKNPRVAVPRAINRVFYRILFFYILSLLAVGLLLPYDHPRLGMESDDVRSSPFVVAIESVGTKVLPDIFNAIILITIVSAGNSDIYIASRVLYGLAESRLAPRFFMRTNKLGVPYVAVFSSGIFGGLAYLNISSEAKKAFDWLMSMTAVAGFFCWLMISLSHIRFMQVLKHRGISRDDLPFKAKFMPWGAYYSAFFVILIVFIQGFTAFAPKFDAKDFIAYYVSAFLFIIVWIVAQFFIFKTRVIHTLDDVDIDSDRRELEQQEQEWNAEETAPKNVWEKIWAALA